MDTKLIRQRINTIVLKHLTGQHDQKKHGNRRGGRLAQDVRKHFGFSYSILTNSSPTSGFMVSIDKKNELVYKLKDFSGKDIDKYIKDHQKELSLKDSYVGGWVNKRKRKVYLDVSIHVNTREEAIALGRKNNQEAFYDVVKGKTVYL